MGMFRSFTYQGVIGHGARLWINSFFFAHVYPEYCISHGRIPSHIHPHNTYSLIRPFKSKFTPSLLKCCWWLIDVHKEPLLIKGGHLVCSSSLRLWLLIRFQERDLNLTTKDLNSPIPSSCLLNKRQHNSLPVGRRLSTRNSEEDVIPPTGWMGFGSVEWVIICVVRCALQSLYTWLSSWNGDQFPCKQIIRIKCDYILQNMSHWDIVSFSTDRLKKAALVHWDT